MSAGATEAVEIVLTTGDRVGVGAGASVDVVLDSGRGDWIRTSDPCAQGKPWIGLEVPIREQLAAFAGRCDQTWDHPSGEAWRSEANDCSAPTTAIRSSSIRRLEAHAL